MSNVLAEGKEDRCAAEAEEDQASDPVSPWAAHSYGGTLYRTCCHRDCAHERIMIRFRKANAKLAVSRPRQHLLRI